MTEIVRASKYRNVYGITIEDYDRMLAEQGGGCAICGRTENDHGTRLCVDHDHETGKARGILCSHCNTGIAYFSENVETFNKAIAYLEANK